MTTPISTGEFDPEEVATTEAIIRIAYRLLSGRAAEPRQWDRWRALFAPGARLIPLETGPDGMVIARVMTPEEYIESRTPFFSQHDFFEWETDREELGSGRLAHVWSSYQAAHAPGGRAIRRGVNSVQLWHDGMRWWILSIAWDAAAAAEAAID
jgi:hypothetical protein